MKRVILLLGCALASSTSAHQSSMPAAGLSVATVVDAAFRSDGVPRSGVWQVPGALMGGEANAEPAGWVLEHASFRAAYRTTTSTFAVGELGTHGHGLALEQSYLGVVFGDSWLALGRQTLDLRNTAAEVGAAPPFADPSLVQDVFYGRYLQDVGALWNWSAAHGRTRFRLGSWAGEAFPAHSDARAFGAASMDVTQSWAARRWQGQWHGYVYLAQPKQRQDVRVSGEHSHSSAQSADTGVAFDGELWAAGMVFDARWESAPVSWQVRAVVDWLNMDGDLSDPQRLAALSSRYSGFEFGVWRSQGRHTVGVRYERLTLTNDLYGPAGAALAQSAGLLRPYNPARWTLGYHWRWRPHLLLQCEQVLNDADALGRPSHFRLGVRWSWGTP